MLCDMSRLHENSPMTSMQELPAWLVNRAPSTTAFGNGRLKLLLIAVACMVLGYFVTSSFGPGDDIDTFEFDQEHDLASTGILEGPNSYPGGDQLLPDSSTSKLGSSKNSLQHGDHGIHRKPSIKGALNELHSAVSNKVTSWRPWSADVYPDANITSPLEMADSQALNPTAAPLKSEEVIGTGSDGFGHRTRIGKCTIVLYGSSIYERTVRTHATHDRIHGYPMHVLRQTIMDDVWSKPAYILSLLLRELAKPQEERLEWLLWIDADTIMLNPYIPLELFLPPSPQFDDIHLLVTHDWNGLNNGVFPVRVSQWAVELFSAIVSFRHYQPEIPLTFRDQSAMDLLLKEKKFATHTIEAPQRWFNAYQGEHNETLAPHQVRRGDFLVHFAGVGNRDERIMFWLDRAEQHLPDWEIEVQHTSYPAEVKDFWVQKANQRKSNKEEVVEARRKATEIIAQTDSQMTEYQDRLTPVDMAAIEDRKAALKRVVEVDSDVFDIPSVNSEMALLSQTLVPLNEAVERAHKILMKEVHDAIFAAEKDIIEASGQSTPELADVEQKATSLKTLVVQPDWQKAELSNAIEALKQARTSLQQKVQETEAQSGKLQQAEAKAIEERRKQEEQKAKFGES